MIKNSSIFNLKLFFFIVISFREAKQSIYSWVYFFCIIINPKIISIELLGLIYLTNAKILYIYKFIKIVIACKDKKFIFTIF